MSPGEISLRELQLRKEHPEFFQHPAAGADEVWVGDCFYALLALSLDAYRRAGMPSIRSGSEYVMRSRDGHSGRKFPFYPLFVKIAELVAVEAALEKN
jgi:hypothetical protein